ncbi:hypothetical protein NUU61_004496 [Penicillium alfredii]|uniref:E3 ubiquitin ligase complex SCF subunit sconC n=1 Tax=Penicillium alfredii TaxID=1506179 RepID=A0A9W9FLD2_9EURO|nr:uncharacterized protein NUU61_004496 [Penicillium alfredii]KAJ5102274.1 hypothetical protein NUU61_004496 [Penicillium alfredii]
MAQSTQSEYVTLVSCDGFEFIIPRSAACISGTIRRMLDPSSNFSEAVTGRCVLNDMTCVIDREWIRTTRSGVLVTRFTDVGSFAFFSAVVLEKVCEYFCYNEKHKDQANVPDMDVPAELCLELLMAADYLDT